jgi:hypothetical protein
LCSTAEYGLAHPILIERKRLMSNEPVPSPGGSAGLPGVLRLTAGLTIIALAILAGLVVLEVVTLEQVLPQGRQIVLLALIVALAAAGIAGLVGWGRRNR